MFVGWAMKVVLTCTHSLFGNDIGAEGAGHLSEALKVNKSVTYLK